MILAHNTKKLKSWIAAAALGLGVVALMTPAEARGFGGFRGGVGGVHGGGSTRGFTHFRHPFVFIHPGPLHSPSLNRRGFAGRQFFFRRGFADDQRFLFHGGRFAEPFANGFDGNGYRYWAYDSEYATYPSDQGMTQTSSSYEQSVYATSSDGQGMAPTAPSRDDPYKIVGASGRRCSLLIKVEKSGDQFIDHRTPLC